MKRTPNLPPGLSKRREITYDDITRLAEQADEPLDPIETGDKETETLLASVGDYFNRDNPLSLYSQLPAGFQRTVDSIPIEHWDDPEKYKYAITHTTRVDRALRRALWGEYAVSTQRREPMNISAMCTGICSPGYFYALATRWHKVLFLFTPPMDYLSEMTSLQDLAMTRMREILTLPFENNGKHDPKLIKLVLQAAAMVDQRLHGAPKQSIEQTNKNANVSLTLHGEVKDMQPQSMEDIDKRLAEIEGKIKQPLPGPTAHPMEKILGDMKGKSSLKAMEADFERVDEEASD